MTAQTNAPVIIIKRKKKGGGDGHHGGAWKVAYADFVTAMMAFFMLMWLLNATTESQRKGIADYFSPSIPLARVSGGGDGSFGGDSVFTEETLARNGTGSGSAVSLPEDGENSSRSKTEEDNFAEIETLLSGGGGESLVMDNARKHIMTRLTDEGLIVEIFDLEDDPLFQAGSDEPTKTLQTIAKMLTDVFGIVTNKVAVNGYVSARPIILIDNPVWDLSSARSDQLRRMLEKDGLDAGRIQRITGYADRKPAVSNPMSKRNNRIELVLLRSDQKEN